MTSSSLPERLRKIRGKLSQAAFAAQIGVTQRTVGYYETGQRVPDAVCIANICSKFKISPSWLLLGVEDEKLLDHQKIDPINMIIESICNEEKINLTDNQKLALSMIIKDKLKIKIKKIIYAIKTIRSEYENRRK